MYNNIKYYQNNYRNFYDIINFFFNIHFFNTIVSRKIGFSFIFLISEHMINFDYFKNNGKKYFN